MILKKVFIYPSLEDDYDDRLRDSFRYESRSFCYYLERRLKDLKFQSEFFSKMCIIGRKEPGSICDVNSSNAVAVEVPFEMEDYIPLKGDLAGANRLFLQLFQYGVGKINKQHKIPADSLLMWARDFEDGQFGNCWVHKSKRIRGSSAICKMVCNLTTESFCMSLLMEENGNVLSEIEVLTTKPDEIFFDHYLGDLRMQKNCILLLDRSKNPFYELDTGSFE